MDISQKKGRPLHLEHICSCCKKKFDSALQKAKHETYMKKSGKFQVVQKTAQSVLTPSINHDFIPEIIDPSLFKSFAKPIDKSLTSATTDETLLKALEKTAQYKEAKLLCDSGDFCNLPSSIDRKYGLSFLTITSKMVNLPNEFVPALIEVIKAIGIDNIPHYIFPSFVSYMNSFDPSLHERDEIDLKVLYEFSKKVGCSFNWLTKLNDITHLVVEPSTLVLDESGPLVDSFLSQLSLFSASFFQTFDQVMSHASYQRGFQKYVDSFFDFLALSQDKHVHFELLLTYVKLARENPLHNINELVTKILAHSQSSIKNDNILGLVNAMIKYDQQLVLKILKSRFEDEDMSSFMARMEEILQEKEQTAKIAEQEKQQKLRMEKMQQAKLRQQEEIKNKQDEDNKFKQQEKELQEEEDFLKLLEEKLTEIQALNEQENRRIIEEVKAFREELQDIANQMGKILRVEQLIIMTMLLKSHKYRNLVQLATSSGKSFMLGIMAAYLNLKHKTKVAVVVPTDTLASIQQKKCCSLVNETEDDLWDSNVKEVHYCTYQDFLKGNIPLGTILLVDEIDSLFFADIPKIIKGDIISSVLLLNKYKVYGMSATFRGQQGKRKMERLINDCNFIETPVSAKERKLKVDVFGEQANIYQKVFEVAKEKIKETPVIIIVKSIEECQALQDLFKADRSFIFGEGRVPAQLGVLGVIQKQQNPFPIVLTTPFASLGHDIAEVAYVIQTELPDSWATFVQNMGRGNRIDPDATLHGAFITPLPFNDIIQIKQGCEYEEKKQKLFNDHYLRNLQYLENLAPTTSAQQREFDDAFKIMMEGKSFDQMLSCFKKTKLGRKEEVSQNKSDSKALTRQQQQYKLSNMQSENKKSSNYIQDFDFDAVANFNLPDTEKDEVFAAKQFDDLSLGKRKQQEIEEYIASQVLEEKTGTDCLTKHKKLFKQCTNGTKKNKHCDACGAAAVRLQNKYWHCGTCNFSICDGCTKQGKIGSLFFSAAGAAGTLKRQKRDEAAEEVLLQQHKGHQEPSSEQELEKVSTFQDDIVMSNIQSQQVDSDAIKEKEIAEAKAVLQKHGMLPPQNKRKQKEADKSDIKSTTSNQTAKKSEGGKSSTSMHGIHKKQACPKCGKSVEKRHLEKHQNSKHCHK